MTVQRDGLSALSDLRTLRASPVLQRPARVPTRSLCLVGLRDRVRAVIRRLRRAGRRRSGPTMRWTTKTSTSPCCSPPIQRSTTTSKWPMMGSSTQPRRHPAGPQEIVERWGHPRSTPVTRCRRQLSTDALRDLNRERCRWASTTSRGRRGLAEVRAPTTTSDRPVVAPSSTPPAISGSSDRPPRERRSPRPTGVPPRLPRSDRHHRQGVARRPIVLIVAG